MPPKQKSRESKPYKAALLPNYFDRLPNELLLHILNVAAPRDELNAFELQNELVSQASIDSRFRHLRPPSNEYAIGTKLHLKRLVTLLNWDRKRGRKAKILVVDFSEDENAGRKRLTRDLLKLMPDLEEVELHSLNFDKGRDGNNLGAMFESGFMRALLKLKAIKSFTISHPSSDQHNMHSYQP